MIQKTELVLESVKVTTQEPNRGGARPQFAGTQTDSDNQGARPDPAAGGRGGQQGGSKKREHHLKALQEVPGDTREVRKFGEKKKKARPTPLVLRSIFEAITGKKVIVTPTDHVTPSGKIIYDVLVLQNGKRVDQFAVKAHAGDYAHAHNRAWLHVMAV